MAALFHRAVGQKEHQRDKRDKIHDVGQADDAVGEVAQPRFCDIKETIFSTFNPLVSLNEIGFSIIPVLYFKL